MNNEILELVQQLVNCYEEAYKIYEPEIKYIITNKITDINYIERTLDGVLDIYTEKGFNLFIELLLYYRTINIENAKEYLEILKEVRTEEYEDFVKKYKKSR